MTGVAAPKCNVFLHSSSPRLPPAWTAAPTHQVLESELPRHPLPHRPLPPSPAGHWLLSTLLLSGTLIPPSIPRGSGPRWVWSRHPTLWLLSEMESTPGWGTCTSKGLGWRGGHYRGSVGWADSTGDLELMLRAIRVWVLPWGGGSGGVANWHSRGSCCHPGLDNRAKVGARAVGPVWQRCQLLTESVQVGRGCDVRILIQA